jgi:selenocysteine-specific elongation factor
VDEVHEREPLRPGTSLDALRASVPPGCPPEAADQIIGELVEAGRLALVGNVVSRVGFAPTLNASQQALRSRIEELYREAGWAPPRVDELPEALVGQPDLWPLLRLLEGQGVLTALEDGHFMDSAALGEAITAVRGLLSGKDGLGPADFREALPLTRKHLIPVLGYFDRTGVTERNGERRRVP